MRACIPFLAIVVFGALVPSQAQAQAIPTLAIVSPVNETVVQAGQTIQVTVNATNVTLLTMEAVVGTDPLGVSLSQTVSPQQIFSITVPNPLHPGRYFITALGKRASGGTVQSAPVSIIVPINGPVSSLRVSGNPLVLLFPGDQSGLDVVASTPSGSVTLTSVNLSFTSDDPSVASVGSNGIVIGQKPGNTLVHVNYGTGASAVSAGVRVLVGGSVRGDFNGDDRVDTSDIFVLNALLNTRANGPNDARDLNHDGKIDALDARVLTTLCTYARCAVSQ
jgi:hypothetical protein